MSGLTNAWQELRLRLARSGHSRASRIFLTDPAWRGPLIASVKATPGERILDMGDIKAGVALSLSKNVPGARVTALDWSFERRGSDKKALIAAGLQVLDFPSEGRAGKLPCSAASFDKVVSSMRLYLLSPGEKLQIAREMKRILRRGGTLHLAEMDRPEKPREGTFLKVAGARAAPENLAPHEDGSWTAVLAKAGFAGVTRLSSHSITTARVTVVRARRP